MVGVSRRWVLGVVGGLVGGLSGCGAFDFPRHRELDFRRVEAVDDGEFVYRVEVGSSASGRSREWRTFHEVVLVAFGQTGSRVGEVQLGDVVADGEHEPVRIECSAAAVLMSFVAREGPCDADTEIGVTRRVGDQGWRRGDTRECGEGLPPEPLTPTESE